MVKPEQVHLGSLAFLHRDRGWLLEANVAAQELFGRKSHDPGIPKIRRDPRPETSTYVVTVPNFIFCFFGFFLAESAESIFFEAKPKQSSRR